MAEQASEAKSTEEQQDERVEPTVVIITGMSGQGARKRSMLSRILDSSASIIFRPSSS